MDMKAIDFMKTLTDIEKIYFIIGMKSFGDFMKVANKAKTGQQVFEEVKTEIVGKLNSLDFDGVSEVVNRYVELTTPTTDS